MGTAVAISDRVYIGALDASGLANELNFGDLACEMKPSTTFNDGGYECSLPGLISGSGMVKGNADFSVTAPALSSQYPITMVPSQAAVAVADPCWFSRGVIAKRNPFGGAVGDTAASQWDFNYDTAQINALVAHPLAARTTDANGTAVALTGPLAAQKLYAVLHVTAYSGLTNVVFKIQSDDNSGFSSATDRITFATVTGTTSEFKSVAGAFSSETHHRITWDVTGSGSVSFVAAFGVL